MQLEKKFKDPPFFFPKSKKKKLVYLLFIRNQNIHGMVYEKVCC